MESQNRNKKPIHIGRGRIIATAVLAVLIVLSIVYGKQAASRTSHHAKSLAYLEDRDDSAKLLIGAASGSAFLISMIPEDTATPNANQIASIGKDFLIVLSAITAERYMLTIMGYVSFCWIIPAALLILILYVLTGGRSWRQLGIKLVLLGLILYEAVPISIRISRLVDDSYQQTVNATLEATRNLQGEFHQTDLPETEASDAKKMEKETSEEEQSWLDVVTGTIADAGEAVGDMIDGAAQGAKEVIEGAVELAEAVPGLPQEAASLANQFMDAFVVMLVTTCIIPVVTLLGLIWGVSLLMGIDLRSLRAGEGERRS